MNEFRGVPNWRTWYEKPGFRKRYSRLLMTRAELWYSQKCVCSNPAWNVCDPVTYETEACEVRLGNSCAKPYSAGVLVQ